MSEVTRVNDPNIAPLDGVALGAKCIVTRFSTAKNKVVSIKSQEADGSLRLRWGHSQLHLRLERGDGNP